MSAHKPTLPTLVNHDGVLYPLNGKSDGMDWIADCRATPCYADEIERRCNTHDVLVKMLSELCHPDADCYTIERACTLLRELVEAE